MRNAFIQELVLQARLHPHIALIVGDLGYSVIEPFADEFPDRFINAGIAEQNMTGIASGMASEGYHVFTYSIANFPTFRCAEQVRNDVAYHNLPVTVVSVGGGLAYGALGYSHHAVQDYALIRILPNMLIAAPGDPCEVQSCMRYLIANPGPSYLRLGKAGEPNFHLAPPVVKPGLWVKVRGGQTNSVLLSTGAGLQIAMEMQLNDKYSGYSVFSMPLWSMAVKDVQVENLCLYDEVVTVEDHLQDGGFGSWLLEAKAKSIKNSCVVKIHALDPIVCGTVGSQLTLNRLGGLTD
jgi:transketolase